MGISFDKTRKLYQATIYIANGKSINLGRFVSRDMAERCLAEEEKKRGIVHTISYCACGAVLTERNTSGKCKKCYHKDYNKARDATKNNSRTIGYNNELKCAVDLTPNKTDTLPSISELMRMKHTPPMAKQRKCLRCDQLFNSTGPHHRFCVKCKAHNREHEGGV